MKKNINFNKEKLSEGYFFLTWLKSRLIRQNKNVLGVELGPTGSGKSYRDLRKAELWYDFYFKEKFPTENICFGVLQVMELVSAGKLRRGEVIIFEEAGANLGSLDFQNKISKMFTYVLQSFRSMNVAIFFNLPYFSMLNKQARMLMHYISESAGVNMGKGQNKCKFFLQQINQSSGKSYPKYPQVNYKGKTRKIKRFTYNKPSDYIIEAYEDKKAAYLKESTMDYVQQIKDIQNKDKPKPVEIKQLSEEQKNILRLREEGNNNVNIAKIKGISAAAVSKRFKVIDRLILAQRSLVKSEN